MNGFRLIYGKSMEWNLTPQTQDVIRFIQMGRMCLWQQTSKKFLEDKLWQNEKSYFIAVEGVLYNREYIVNHKIWNDPTSWRGSFAYVHYDKQTDVCRVYNDQVGSKMLFWCQQNKSVYVSSDIFELIHVSGYRQPNIDCIRELLKDGYSRTSHTAVQGIHRLLAGRMLEISANGVSEKEYHHFNNSPIYTDVQQITAEMESRFTQAIRRVLEKNREYGLRNFFPLSGGLDSRMAQIVAHKCATDPIENFTYSQTGHYDHLLPEQIAAYLGNKWHFLSLDGGNYLAHIDDIVRQSQMLLNYNGPSEIKYCVDNYDWQNCGVVLTGVNGDSIFSSVTDAKHDGENLYGQCFAADGLGSPLFLQYVTESQSPFMDVDVLEYMMHVSHKLRWNNKIYDAWILRYHPEAVQWHHKYETIGHRHWALPIRGKKVFLREIPNLIWSQLQKRLHIFGGGCITEQSMNPYDEWVMQNPSLRQSLDEYYQENKSLLHRVPELYDPCSTLYRYGTVYQQCKVLTILSILKNLNA